MMHVNRTSKWKVSAIWISRELPLFNYERLDMSWASIIHSSQNLWPFEFAECFRVKFWGSRYLMHVNRTSEWKVIAILITRELPFFNFECLNISWASIIHSSQKLWPFEFAKSFRVQFWGSQYMMHVNRTFKWKVSAILITWELPLFNFEHLDISWTSIIHSSQKLWPFEIAKSFRIKFRVCGYMMHVIRTSKWKV